MTAAAVARKQASPDAKNPPRSASPVLLNNSSKFLNYNRRFIELLNLALRKTSYEDLPPEITMHFERGVETRKGGYVTVTRVKQPLSEEHAKANVAEIETAMLSMGINVPVQKESFSLLIEEPPPPVPKVQLYLKEPPTPGGILDKVLALVKEEPQIRYTPDDFWEMMGWSENAPGQWLKDAEVRKAAGLFHVLLVLRKRPEEVLGPDFRSSRFRGLFVGNYKGHITDLLVDAGLVESTSELRKIRTKVKQQEPVARTGKEVLEIVNALIAAERERKKTQHVGPAISKRQRKLAKKRRRASSHEQPEPYDMKKHFWPLAGWNTAKKGKWKDPEIREAALLFFGKLVFKGHAQDCTAENFKEHGLFGLLSYYNLSPYDAFKSVNLVTEAHEAYMRSKGSRRKKD